MGLVRVLLALSVILCHVGPADGFRLIPADLAVQCFFIISGFYMSIVLGNKYAFSRKGVFTFYCNRYLRLAPNFWLATTGCIGLAIYTGRTYYGVDTESYLTLLARVNPLSAIWVCFTNLFMVGQDTLIFLKFQDGNLVWNPDMNNVPGAAIYLLLIPPAWSLGVELWFYMIAPVLAARRWQLLMALFLVCLVVRIAAAIYGYSEEPWKDRFFPFELGWFLLGMLLQRGHRLLARKILKSVSMATLAAIVASMLAYNFIPVEGEILHWLYLAIFAPTVPLLFELTKNSGMDRAIGELSYPLYLFHTVVHQALGGASTFVVVFASFVAAGAAYLLVDRQVDGLRQQWARERF